LIFGQRLQRCGGSFQNFGRGEYSVIAKLFHQSSTTSSCGFGEIEIVFKFRSFFGRLPLRMAEAFHDDDRV
jgi:hypothetical protein